MAAVVFEKGINVRRVIQENMSRRQGKAPNYCRSAGTPDNDTNGACAMENGDICYDSTNEKVYIATAVSFDDDETTWVEVVI